MEKIIPTVVQFIKLGEAGETVVQFIKLGEAGEWERQCLS